MTQIVATNYNTARVRSHRAQNRRGTAGHLELELALGDRTWGEGGTVREEGCSLAQRGESGFLRGKGQGRRLLFPEIKPFRS